MSSSMSGRGKLRILGTLVAAAVVGIVGGTFASAATPPPDLVQRGVAALTSTNVQGGVSIALADKSGLEIGVVTSATAADGSNVASWSARGIVEFVVTTSVDRTRVVLTERSTGKSGVATWDASTAHWAVEGAMEEIVGRVQSDLALLSLTMDLYIGSVPWRDAPRGPYHPVEVEPPGCSGPAAGGLPCNGRRCSAQAMDWYKSSCIRTAKWETQMSCKDNLCDGCCDGPYADAACAVGEFFCLCNGWGRACE